MKIFDENGNELNINEVVGIFIEEKAKKYNKDVESTLVGIWKGVNDSKYIYTVEDTDNGYDATDLIPFGIDDKIEKKRDA